MRDDYQATSIRDADGLKKFLTNLAQLCGRDSQTFRTGKHPHVIPTAGLVLRSAQLAWNKFSPTPPISLSRSILDAVFPTDMELTTGLINLGPRTQRGCLGWVTYRCPDRDAAATPPSEGRSREVVAQ